MDIQEARLRILEHMIPKASAVGISDPKRIIEICSEFEKYVVGSEKESEDSLTSQPKTAVKSPRKGQAKPKTVSE